MERRWPYWASKKYNLSELKINRLTWKKVLEDALNPENKEMFLNRKNAVDMYIAGASLATIEKETTIKKTKVGIFVKKCYKINPDTNEPYGYAALIPYHHIEKYNIPFLIYKHLFEKLHKHIFALLQIDIDSSLDYSKIVEFSMPDYVVTLKDNCYDIYMKLTVK